MKKILIFLALVVYVFTPTFVFAQETFMPVQTGVSSTSAEQTEEANVDEYQLPYPGLLPSNPFYFLKAFRDNIIGFLINDPLKKAEFDLLQADKRLQAAVLLIEKEKKYDLAETTISKGQNYFEEAIVKIGDADREKQQTADIKDRVQKAARKHKAVITDLQKNAPKDKKDAYSKLQQRMEQLETRVGKFSLQNEM